jgi:hypothetical protein
MHHIVMVATGKKSSFFGIGLKLDHQFVRIIRLRSFDTNQSQEIVTKNCVKTFYLLRNYSH